MSVWWINSNLSNTSAVTIPNGSGQERKAPHQSLPCVKGALGALVPVKKLEFGEGGNILSAPLRCPQCHNAEDWKEVPSFGRGIPINNNVRIFAPRGILTVFLKMRYKCGKCGYTAKYSQW